MAITFISPREEMVNNWKSQLNGAITSGSTSIAVDSVAGLPSDGYFRVQIGMELILCSGTSGSNLTVKTRGIEGTTAAAHSDNSIVAAVITAGSLRKFLLENRGTGFSEESTTQSVPLGRILDADGSVLTASDFTWYNQGSATLSDGANGGLVMKVPSVNGNNQRIALVSSPTAPFRAYARIRIGPGVQDAGGYMGLVLKNSGSNRLITSLWQWDGALSMERWNSATSYDSTIDAFSYFQGDTLWVSIEDNNSVVHVKYSADGNNWTPQTSAWMSQGRTTWLTSGANQVGIYANSSSSGSNPADADTAFIFDCFVIEDQ